MKWRGFLHCLVRPKFEHVFIEITDFAWQRLKVEKGDRQSLRGMICLFARERKTVKSPLVITRVGEESPGKTLPKVRTPEETLKLLWKLPG
jgi:hypothetical protein